MLPHLCMVQMKQAAVDSTGLMPICANLGLRQPTHFSCQIPVCRQDPRAEPPFRASSVQGMYRF